MLKKLLILTGTASRQPVFVTASALVFASSSLTLWAGILLLTTLAYTPELNREPEKRQAINSAVSTEAINGRHFFGQADEEPQVIIETLPETKLNLTLAGLFASPNQKDGGAIIINQRQQSQFFSIGEKLPSGVTLQSVHRDRVVINRNGMFETLFIQDIDAIQTRFTKNKDQPDRMSIIRQRIEELKKQKAANQ
ncbi:MAG: type II secretion system protein N [Pseudomonadales bacterium]|nr:type II secretion system protein N [Pseudomonadales bacterium]